MDYDIQRKKMVDEQLIPRGINDPRVLEAFMSVPRHVFVPGPFDVSFYADRPLPIGEGQTISQPYMVALMTECLRLEGDEKVLEIGTGSGYQAAILAKLCVHVCTIEREKRLLDRAQKILQEEGYDNIEFKCGDGTVGWEEEGPYDGIIVTAGAPHIPEALKQQLAEGGRLVIPVGGQYGQMLVVVTRRDKDFTQDSVCGCIFVPLIGEDGWHISE
jgi:protein-L-isoaspartate(D-aspartate) O-methyltransferase